MKEKISLIVTSIAAPNKILASLAKGCVERGFEFILMGDTKSPGGFSLQGCNFYSIEKQLKTGFTFAQKCPRNHYARKNIGYLLGMRNCSDIIFETDDDNAPLENFWHVPSFMLYVKQLSDTGWTNVYKYFTEDNIWPRGIALEAIHEPLPDYHCLKEGNVFCPIQQGVVNGNPDVDAICRLIMPGDHEFRNDRQVAIGRNSWAPFNSQCTKWVKDAFGLLYLPAYCSFRMTDIYRSLVAQRIAWENNWSVLFHEPNMYQERNAHDLLRDFEDEIPGYLNSARIAAALESLSIKSGKNYIPENLNLCYEKLVEMNIVGKKEIPLLNYWLKDFCELTSGSSA